MAGTHSGVGKTTVATGLMAALSRREGPVGGAKVGPDFIDPGYHRLATGRPSRNLDPFLTSPAATVALAGKASSGARLLVVEGVMGLFDGASAPTAPGELPVASTAAVAAQLRAPVVLVVDAASIGQSVAAVVHGYSTFRAGVEVSAVVLNRVGSDSHELLLRRELEAAGVRVLGCLRRDPALEWRDRHLGLVPVAERPGEVRRALERLAAAVERSIDLGAVVRLAREAPALGYESLPPASRQSGGVAIAVAGGSAFTFQYPDNLERLEEAGGRLESFDPTRAHRLPEKTAALYAGGGYPEVFAEALAGNRPLLEDVRRRVAAGLPVWAECGGLLWLAESLGGHRLCGAVPARGEMTGRLTVGYRRARVIEDNPVAPAGAELRGHELHYSRCEPAGGALELTGHDGATRLGGFASATLLASYLHLHLGADPAPAERFVRLAASAA